MASLINSDNGVSSGSAGLKSSADSSGVLQLQTNGTAALTVDTSQNVGIGTASPASKLDITATLRAVSSTAVAPTSGKGVEVWYDSSGDFGRIATYDRTGAAYKNQYIDGAALYLNSQSSGNVGIGTTSPVGQFDVYTNSNTVAYQTYVRNLSAGSSAYAIAGWGNNSNNNAGQIAIASSTNTTYGSGGDFIFLANTGTMNFRTTTAQPMTFFTNATERMRIDSSGNLLVGTTSTIQGGKVNVATATSVFTGTTSAGAGAGIGLDLQRTAANGDICYFRSTTGLAGYITITGANTCTYNQVSDVRLKENIVNAPSALSKVESLQVRSFDWKDGSGAVPYGFIAQELEEVVPEAVSHGTTNEDGSMLTPWGIDTSLIVPYLTKAIQEQQALITQLTNRISALESK